MRFVFCVFLFIFQVDLCAGKVEEAFANSIKDNWRLYLALGSGAGLGYLATPPVALGIALSVLTGLGVESLWRNRGDFDLVVIEFAGQAYLLIPFGFAYQALRQVRSLESDLANAEQRLNREKTNSLVTQDKMQRSFEERERLTSEQLQEGLRQELKVHPNAGQPKRLLEILMDAYERATDVKNTDQPT